MVSWLSTAMHKAAVGFVPAAAMLLVAMSVPASGKAAADQVEGVPARLRLDQVQELGSHNSYKRYPSPAEEQHIRTLAPEYWDGLAYGHPPLEAQFAIGIRQIEIDVAPDPDGGLYLAPYLDTTPDARRSMMAPGAKVLHFPQLDVETHCLTFRACLATLRRWSDAHPDHLPLTVLVNASDFPPIAGLWTHDARFDEAGLAMLDSDILSEIGRSRVITPDDVRGSYRSLADAVRAHAWPTLGNARGKFMFVLDAAERHYALYAKGHASLLGRVMFGYYPETAPEAAIFNIQDPRGQEARIGRLVREGFLVRTRADADTQEARKNDRRRLDAAIASGAQFVSTDFYDGAPNPQGFAYRAALPGNLLLRCNPLTAVCVPAAQTSKDLAR
ncbi:hypothetical protein WSK_4040 [Novosphingobium sp. Rr 2-17]|uniref:Ca2+-dependent phosphoinositide-specific phospholipase C n=1 Tax=Novosphingobium sp. Rr 2-17 TaxID=555793 RepID=UPI0002699C13|nr:Ca2+-dependent phosphoinositide-specific phospholipase C [Novosphingobium sp. Rr 2-17]EIZ77426.1 hypothetical protein WSK_4040 [Novosphingobium sp. Rr 2-17]